MESLNLNLKATNEVLLVWSQIPLFYASWRWSLGIQICIKLQKLFLGRLSHISPHELKNNCMKIFLEVFFLSVTLPRRKMKNDVVNVARLKCKGSKFSLIFFLHAKTFEVIWMENSHSCAVCEEKKRVAIYHGELNPLQKL